MATIATPELANSEVLGVQTNGVPPNSPDLRINVGNIFAKVIGATVGQEVLLIGGFVLGVRDVANKYPSRPDQSRVVGFIGNLHHLADRGNPLSIAFEEAVPFVGPIRTGVSWVKQALSD